MCGAPTTGRWLGFHNWWLIASAAIGLLGSLLLSPTTALAEYDVQSALQAYESADSDNRKVWELIFGNTYVLVQ
jgi:hypothetical protein